MFGFMPVVVLMLLPSISCATFIRTAQREVPDSLDIKRLHDRVTNSLAFREQVGDICNSAVDELECTQNTEEKLFCQLLEKSRPRLAAEYCGMHTKASSQSTSAEKENASMQNASRSNRSLPSVNITPAIPQMPIRNVSKASNTSFSLTNSSLAVKELNPPNASVMRTSMTAVHDASDSTANSTGPSAFPVTTSNNQALIRRTPNNISTFVAPRVNSTVAAINPGAPSINVSMLNNLSFFRPSGYRATRNTSNASHRNLTVKVGAYPNATVKVVSSNVTSVVSTVWNSSNKTSHTGADITEVSGTKAFITNPGNVTELSGNRSHMSRPSASNNSNATVIKIKVALRNFSVHTTTSVHANFSAEKLSNSSVVPMLAVPENTSMVNISAFHVINRTSEKESSTSTRLNSIVTSNSSAESNSSAISNLSRKLQVGIKQSESAQSNSSQSGSLQSAVVKSKDVPSKEQNSSNVKSRVVNYKIGQSRTVQSNDAQSETLNAKEEQSRSVQSNSLSGKAPQQAKANKMHNKKIQRGRMETIKARFKKPESKKKLSEKRMSKNEWMTAAANIDDAVISLKNLTLGEPLSGFTSIKKLIVNDLAFRIETTKLSHRIGCKKLKHAKTCSRFIEDAVFCLGFAKQLPLLTNMSGYQQEKEYCKHIDEHLPQLSSLLQGKAKLSIQLLQKSDNFAPEDQLAQEMTHDLEMNFNKIAPFGKEDTAKELQDHAAKTQDTLVDAVENAEVAEIKRAVFRALTRLRAATIKEFDTIARLETQAIDAYNDAHHYRAENPLAHLHEDEAPVETDKLKSFH